MTEASGAHNPQLLPAGIPVPQDDGAARHLAGTKLPDLALPATDGAPVNLSRLRGRTVIYIYPRTGVPGVDPPADAAPLPTGAATALRAVGPAETALTTGPSPAAAR